MLKKIRKLIPTLGLVMVFLLLIAIPVLAQNYYANISVAETEDNSYGMYPFLKSLNVTNLVDNNFILATGLDTRVLEGATELPHMLADDKLLFADDLPASSSNTYQLTMGNSALSSFDIVLGRGSSIAVVDHATLELGDSFEVEIKGWVDTASGSDKNLIIKDAAFKIYISGAGAITADINAGALTVTATGVTSGLHTIEVIADGADMKIYVDTVEEDSVSLGVVSVADNANGWVVGQNDVLPYMEYVKIWTTN